MHLRQNLILLGLLLSFFSATLWAEGFEIKSAEAVLSESSLSVNAAFDLQISDAVSEALHNGVPIELITTLDLFKKRRYMWNDRIARWTFLHQISFHPLTNRYVLHLPQSSDSQSFSSLNTLLTQIESLDFKSEILGNTLPTSEHGYKLKLRIALNRTALPAPLRVMAHVLPAWWLKSDAHEWFIKG